MVNYEGNVTNGSQKANISHYDKVVSSHFPKMLSTRPLSLQSATRKLISWVEGLLANPDTHGCKLSRATIPISYEFDSLLTWLNIQLCEQKLFFSCRDGTFEIAAIGFAYRVFGSSYSDDIHEKLSSLLDDSDPYMRFYGGCRFDDSNQFSDDMAWMPYSGYTFVLPCIELYRDKQDSYFLSANYCPSEDQKQLLTLLYQLHIPTLGTEIIDPTVNISPASDVTEVSSFEEWDASMSAILTDLSQKKYKKIVLSRAKKFQYQKANLPNPVQVVATLENLYRINSSRKNVYKSAQQNGQGKPVHPENSTADFKNPPDQVQNATHGSYIFLLQLSCDQAFLGSPPERLFRVENDSVFTEALAGTVKRSSNGNNKEELTELMGSKNVEEHTFVVDSVKKALDTSGVTVETNGPYVRRLPRLMHLSTDIRGKFVDLSEKLVSHASDRGSISVLRIPKNNVYTLLRNMHPTAAVCGLPAGCTRQALRNLENFDRGFFAGPFGWFSRNEGEFCVAIRSALVQKTSITAFAGSGIVSASESRSEWDETELKMSAFNDIFLNNLQSPQRNYSSSSSRKARASSLSQNDKTVASSTVNNDRQFFDPRNLEDMPNLNTLWGCCCIEELCRNGVTTFFVAPGSRSAPLAIGAVRSKFSQIYVAHDERGAGFLACGFARATGRAAAIITSSGTAVANLLPAVVEAFSDNLPVILLTADRPPELREIGANQTIKQVNIFSNYTLWMKDVPCPSTDVPLRNLLSDIDYAVFISGSAKFSGYEESSARARGPVHLNMMFREKLAPDEQYWDRKYVSNVELSWRNSRNTICSYLTPTSYAFHSQFAESTRSSSVFGSHFERILFELFSIERGLIVIGGGSGAPSTRNDALAIIEMAEALNWPIISDVCGGLRFDSSSEMVVHYSDLIYRSAKAFKSFLPLAVLQIGERITSKNICNLLSEVSKCSTSEKVMHVVLSPSINRCDPCSSVTHRVVCNPGGVTNYVKKNTLTNEFDMNRNGYSSLKMNTKFRDKVDDSLHLGILPEISSRVHDVLSTILDDDTEDQLLSEPVCARIVSENLHLFGGLFIGNSMPIRDLDIFGCPTSHGSKIYVAANRGASGIDGLISTGIGFSIGLRKDVAIMVGDMSTLHDLNALHLLREEAKTLENTVTIIVINNGGGGIFSMLPVAKHEDVFSPIFDTPHSIQMRKACEMFGLKYDLVNTSVELQRVLQQPTTEHRIVEVHVGYDHEQNAKLHRNISQIVADEVTKAISEA